MLHNIVDVRRCSYLTYFELELPGLFFFIFQASGVLGELMISLGYLRLTERLTIVIIRARNLPQAEEAELDPGK